MVAYTEAIHNRTTNPGDRISDKPETIEEKAKQIAVDAPDIAGDHIKVPTYFIVEYPNGEKKALHHVRDAKEISDLVRESQVRGTFRAEDDTPEHFFNWSSIIMVLVLSVLTLPILIGIF
jgi:hypothetical protein